MGKHYFVLHKNNAGKCMIEIQEESKLIGGLPMTIGKSRVFESENELGKILADFLTEFPPKETT